MPCGSFCSLVRKTLNKCHLFKYKCNVIVFFLKVNKFSSLLGINFIRLPILLRLVLQKANIYVCAVSV